MERTVINPWTWQDSFGFVQANAITGVGRLILCAGQTSVDENGTPLHPGDMRAQVAKALDNLEAVLSAAGGTLADVVRLNYYTTDADGLLAVWDSITSRLTAAGCRPTSTLLGVSRLAFPELLVEIEATALT